MPTMDGTTYIMLHNIIPITIYALSPKNAPLCHCGYLHQILTNFQISFTDNLQTISSKAIIKYFTTH